MPLPFLVSRYMRHSPPSLQVYRVTFPPDEAVHAQQAELEAQAASSQYNMDSALFYRLFPFHFIVDMECRLLQVRACWRVVVPGMQL